MMKILIIEDEPGIYNFLKEGLEEEGYIITIATDGKEGMEKYRQEKPNLILLDWMLPQISGIEVCREIRKEDKQTPVLFLTAKDTVEETIEGLQAGAVDYIRKPFSFGELIERIRIHFRDKQADILLSLGDISLNKAEYQVYKNNRKVALTKREFDLMEYLIRHKGQICTRDEIINNVWNINFKYDTGVIDVFINSIRKKLKLDKENGIIKTVRGIGYIVN